MNKLATKPQSQTFEHVETAEGHDIHEVMSFLYEKYDMDCYDVYDSGTHFDKWCNKKGYGETDCMGKQRSSSQIWYKEYQEDPDGSAKCPKYVTVLDWFMEKFSHDQMYNEFKITLEDFTEKDTPEHMKLFAYYLFAEFDKEVTLILSYEDC